MRIEVKLDKLEGVAAGRSSIVNDRWAPLGSQHSYRTVRKDQGARTEQYSNRTLLQRSGAGTLQ